LWALLTIFTCGLWGIVWMIDSMKQRPWRCSRCGLAYDFSEERRYLEERRQQLEAEAERRRDDPEEQEKERALRKTNLRLLLGGALVLVLLAGFFISLLIWAARQPPTIPAARPARPAVTMVGGSLPKTPDAIVALYGRPDRDDSTDRDRPRPFIVTRIMEYKAANVTLIFVPESRAIPVTGWTLVKCGQVTANGEISKEEAWRRLYASGAAPRK
jgi:hypothetical protein